MSEGEGFARRVTRVNLRSFAPLLKQRGAAGQAGGGDTEAADEQPDDSANQGLAVDPGLAAAEALFHGESIKTGIRFVRPTRGEAVPAGGTARRRPRGRNAGFGSDEVLLMRVRPRRDGTQLQISMIVHRSAFMNNAPEVVSASDGSRRGIGYDYTERNGGRVPNLARFEAPEMNGMIEPVARFRWVDSGYSGSAAQRILQYEIFDAVASPQGSEILQRLREGIAARPVTDLERLSRDHTVLSKSDLSSAQWYRLDAV